MKNNEQKVSVPPSAEVEAEKVQRYDRMSSRTANGVKICTMTPTEHGTYVLYTDYAKLRKGNDDE